MGSTDHFNEDTFAPDTNSDGRINSFLGQTATDNWVERLKNNLKISDTDESNSLDHESYGNQMCSQSHSGNFPNATRGLNAPHLGPAVFAEHLEPYELPSKANADLFVTAYFSTIHPSFPILSRARFLKDYEQSFSFMNPSKLSDGALATLHLVLALGAIHTYIMEAPWANEEKSHLLNFAMAKATVLDASIFRVLGYDQVQLCGLGGLYYLIMYDVNK